MSLPCGKHHRLPAVSYFIPKQRNAIVFENWYSLNCCMYRNSAKTISHLTAYEKIMNMATLLLGLKVFNRHIQSTLLKYRTEYENFSYWF